MIRKYYAVHCDRKGCQLTSMVVRTRVGARQHAESLGWQLTKDFRGRDRAWCPLHRKDLHKVLGPVILES